MATAPAGFALGAIRPEDAIAAFQARKLLRPSFRWQEVWQAEHARAFAVAGVTRLDVLATIRGQVEAAVAQGTDLKTFTTQLRQQLVAKGWWGNLEITDPSTGEVRNTRFNNARLALIFDVNMRQSYAAGRWARAQRSPMPYMVYRTMRDEKVRATHRPWDNLVLAKDDPWWDTHYPPNGWRCRCTAFATDEAGLKALRAAAPKDAPVKTSPPPTQWVEFLNRVTGQTERVPRGIDPGFGYNPGKSHIANGVQMLERGLSAIKPIAPTANDALRTVRAVVARTRTERGFKAFLASPPPQDVGMPVAALPAAGGEPSIASVSARALRQQVGRDEFPPRLPTTVQSWALAQAIVDQGQRLTLADGTVLWWWVRGAGATQRVMVLQLERSVLVWWVRRLATLTTDEAVAAYAPLAKLLK